MAAEPLFAEKGFDATSISDISEAADAGRALIYYYFKNKRDLYVSVLRDGADRIFDAAKDALEAEGPSILRLRIFIERFRQLHVERPNLARIAVREQTEGKMDKDLDGKKHMTRVLGMLQKVVEEGIERGEFRQVDPSKAVHMMMGMVHSLIVMQMHGDADPDPERDIDFALAVLARGIST
jgi:AcrR family transcriptional regulator